jgi:hypothetical protein
MFDNYNYPMGADSENAPWNEKMLPYKSFKVCVSQSLSKTTTVNTNDYSELKEKDDVGGFLEIDTDDVVWADEYADNGHLTPLELINLYKQHCKAALDKNPNASDASWYKYIIEECDNWVSDDFEVVEE